MLTLLLLLLLRALPNASRAGLREDLEVLGRSTRVLLLVELRAEDLAVIVLEAEGPRLRIEGFLRMKGEGRLSSSSRS